MDLVAYLEKTVSPGEYFLSRKTICVVIHFGALLVNGNALHFIVHNLQFHYQTITVSTDQHAAAHSRH